MKITAIDFFRIDMPLAVPYTIAYETVDRTSNIILKLTTDRGLTGWGCAAPDREVTGDTPEEVVNNVSRVVEPTLLGEDPFRIALHNYNMRTLVPKASSTVAMVDMALYDLLARQAKMPLFRLLGGYRESIATSITIGILPLRETLEQAGYYLKRGFKILKLKGGISLDQDIEKISKMREMYGESFILRFDANQGYTTTQSIEFIDKTREAAIEILEQPTARDKEERLGEVTRGVDVPVLADESIKTLKDAFRLASNDMIDMVNINVP